MTYLFGVGDLIIDYSMITSLSGFSVDRLSVTIRFGAIDSPPLHKLASPILSAIGYKFNFGEYHWGDVMYSTALMFQLWMDVSSGRCGRPGQFSLY
jgi:hypothetical protein